MQLSFCLITGVQYGNLPGRISGEIYQSESKIFEFRCTS